MGLLRQPILVSESPRLYEVKINRTYLGHILRLLATSHYLREVKPNVFANNRVSSYVDSGKSVAYLRES